MRVMIKHIRGTHWGGRYVRENFWESGIKADNQIRNRNYPEYGVDSSGGRVGGDCVVVVMLVIG